MSEVRLIDAIALEKTAIPCETHNGALTELCVPLYQIRNAPTLPNPCGNSCNFTRPTGEWICTFRSTFYQYEPDEYRCSICNGVGGKSDKFCKHCGAKMKKGEEND